MLGPADQLQLPPGLSEIVRSKSCVAFVGSGLSAGSYPSWAGLINEMCISCGSNCRVDADSPTVAFLDAAQDAKSCSEKNYYAFLGKTFGCAAASASLTYDALLAVHFDAFVTINFDPLLALKARTTRIRCADDIDIFPSLDRRRVGGRSIHYLHGHIAEGGTPIDGTIVLSRDEFEAAYSAHSNLMSFLLPMLENDPIVFIGCRLREPALDEVFRICKDLQLKRQRLAKHHDHQSVPPKRFIFRPLPEVRSGDNKLDRRRGEEIKQEEEGYYLDKDIVPVWYKADDGDHSWLRRALEQLAELRAPTYSYGWNEG